MRVPKGVMVAPTRVLHRTGAVAFAREALGDEAAEQARDEGAATPALRMAEMVLAASPRGED